MKISDEDIFLAIVAMLASGTLTGKELYNHIILALGGRIISPWWFITGRSLVNRPRFYGIVADLIDDKLISHSKLDNSYTIYYSLNPETS